MERVIRICDERQRAVYWLLNEAHLKEIKGWGPKASSEPRTMNTAEVLVGLAEYFSPRGPRPPKRLRPYLLKLKELLDAETPCETRHLAWALCAFASCHSFENVEMYLPRLIGKVRSNDEGTFTWWESQHDGHKSIEETFFATWALCRTLAHHPALPIQDGVENIVNCACDWLAAQMRPDNGWACWVSEGNVDTKNDNSEDPYNSNIPCTAYVCSLLALQSRDKYKSEIEKGLSFISVRASELNYVLPSFCPRTYYDKNGVWYVHAQYQWAVLALLLNDSDGQFDQNECIFTLAIFLDKMLSTDLRCSTEFGSHYKDGLDKKSSDPLVYSTADALFSFNALYDNTLRSKTFPLQRLMKIYKHEHRLVLAKNREIIHREAIIAEKEKNFTEKQREIERLRRPLLWNKLALVSITILSLLCIYRMSSVARPVSVLIGLGLGWFGFLVIGTSFLHNSRTVYGLLTLTYTFVGWCLIVGSGICGIYACIWVWLEYGAWVGIISLILGGAYALHSRIMARLKALYKYLSST